MSSRASICLTLLALSLFSRCPASDWPQWHGPERNRHSPDTVAAALTRLPADLQPAWRRSIGPGHSSPVVQGDTLVYLDDNGSETVVHCLDATTGKERWAHPFSSHFEDEWGVGPRCTPFLDDNHVYVQASNGDFRCLELSDGRLRWELSYTTDLGSRFIGYRPGRGAAPRRGYNGSGLIAGDSVILPVGSTAATLLACDKLTGRERWRAGTEELAYASLVSAPLAGIQQVIAFTADSLLGCDLSDGRMLWRVPFKTAAQRHVSTPVIAGDLVIVNSHTFGLAAIRISTTSEPAGCQAVLAWRNPDLKTNLATGVVVGDSLYILGADKDFVCVEVATGQVRWSEAGFVGAGRRDYAAVLAAGDRLLVLTDDGTLRLLRANPDRYEELGRTQACGVTWVFPALADGRLYVRDGRQLSCLPLQSQPSKP